MIREMDDKRDIFREFFQNMDDHGSEEVHFFLDTGSLPLSTQRCRRHLDVMWCEGLIDNGLILSAIWYFGILAYFYIAGKYTKEMFFITLTEI